VDILDLGVVQFINQNKLKYENGEHAEELWSELKFFVVL
jgi:hypothetical protein